MWEYPPLVKVLSLAFCVTVTAAWELDGRERQQQPLRGTGDIHPAAPCSYRAYTALGDSYAAGLGAKQRLQICTGGANDSSITCTSSDCNKDTGAYGYLFAEKHGLLNDKQFQFLSCSGADTNQILEHQVNTPAFGKPDLITVSGGGDNDRAFFNVVEFCVINLITPSHEACRQALIAANSLINETSGFAKDLDTLYSGVERQIKLNSPSSKATVIVMGYAQFWSNITSTRCGWPFDQPLRKEKAAVNDLVVKANQKLQEAAKRHGFLYADVDALFANKGFCSWAPSTEDFASNFQAIDAFGNDTSGKPYTELSLAHPSLPGQMAYLQALEKTLGCP